MNHKWLEMRVSVPSAAVDAVCGILAEMGSTGVEVETRELDTFIPPDPEADPPAIYSLRAYFPGETMPGELRKQVEQALAPLRLAFPGEQWGAAATQWVADADWAESWKQHFPIFRVGPLVIKPSWEEVEVGPDDVVLTVDPGMAFGTGTHATTRLCLEALVQEWAERGRCPRVLDVGTGSGILALSAAALGAERVLACDIDEEACRVAADNARINDLASRVEITNRPLQELETGFDLVLANILAEENVRLATELISRVAPGGALILSGILQEKVDLVRAGFARYSLAGPEVRVQDDWACLIYRRGQGDATLLC